MSTSTVSEAKRAANARNGKRGGPRTAEGKARSRMNGLQHGLRAEVIVLPGESEEAFRHRLDAWAGDLQPHGAVERYQVETAVAASWRRDRCLRAETAVLTDRVRDAAEPDPERASARAERLDARLADDPVAVAPRLRATSAGCLWMLAEWDDLDATLDSLGSWEHSRLHRALRSALRDLRAEQKRRLDMGRAAGTIATPAEPTGDAPSEPTEAADPFGSPPETIAPSEPTAVADRIAPSEPTEVDPSDETPRSESPSGDRKGSAGGPIAGWSIADDTDEAGVIDPESTAPVWIGTDPTAGEGAPGGPLSS